MFFLLLFFFLHFLLFWLKAFFCGQKGHVSTNLKAHCQNSFYLYISFFSILSSRLSRNAYKLRHKIPNGKNFAPSSLNFWNIFSKLCYGQFRPFFNKSETTISEQFSLFSLFLSFRMSRNMYKMCHKMQNTKKGLALTFTWNSIFVPTSQLPYFLTSLIPYLSTSLLPCQVGAGQ